MLLKLYSKLRKMFLSPRRESKPRPFDLRWDALTIEPYQDEAVYYSPPTFRSLVRRSNHWAVPGRSSILFTPDLYQETGSRANCYMEAIEIEDSNNIHVFPSNMVEVMKQMDANGTAQQTRPRLPSNISRQSSEQPTRPQCSGTLTTTMPHVNDSNNNGKMMMI